MKSGEILGSYEILSPLGAGGMGEVYKAKDLKLGREVAVKFLSPSLVQNSESLKRFEREARVLAALNHPHVAILHGLEYYGNERFLVMELVQGETLHSRLSRGPLPVETAIQLATQIASALEAAHEKKIIHRDLKPANIMVGPHSELKLLDFGLSKLLHQEMLEDQATINPVSNLTTGTETVRGTVPYMSPEQASGKPLDVRTDIWSFGCVLFEMLTANRAFVGESVAVTLAAILQEDPDWNRLPAETPAHIRKLLKRCLQKDPYKRLQSIGDARIELQHPESDSGNTPNSIASTMPFWKWSLPWGLAAVLTVLLLGTFVWKGQTEETINADAVCYRFEIPANTVRYRKAFPLQVSPDGKHFIMSAIDSDGVRRLFIRDPDDLNFQSIAGSEDFAGGFFSPDNQFYYYRHKNRTRGVRLASRSVFDLGIVPGSGEAFGGSVTKERLGIYDDGKLIYSITLPGGKPAQITRLDESKDEILHRYPWFLPDGKRYLFMARSRVESGEERNVLYLASVGSFERKALLDVTSRAEFAPPGDILFARGHTLYAAPFDLETGEITGSEVPILDDLEVNPEHGWAAFTVSHVGILTYQQRTDRSRFALFDPNGRELTGFNRKGSFLSAKVSPDGSHLAVGVMNELTGKSDIWIYGLDRETAMRLTFEPGSEDFPVWIDENRIAYQYYLDDKHIEIRLTSVDNPGQPKTIVSGHGSHVPTDFSTNALLYTERTRGTASLREIWQAPLDGSATPEPVLRGPFTIGWADLSPDRKWLCYYSDESGRLETYVRPWRQPGGKTQISTTGALGRWSWDGSEILLLEGDDLVSVPVTEYEGRMSIGQPDLLFSRVDIKDFHQLPDGRMLLELNVDDRNPPNVVLTNWRAMIKDSTTE